MGFRNRVYIHLMFLLSAKNYSRTLNKSKFAFIIHTYPSTPEFLQTLSVKQSPSHNTPTRFSHNTGTEEKCVPPKHRKALNFQFFAILYFQCTTQQCQNADDRDIVYTKYSNTHRFILQMTT